MSKTMEARPTEYKGIRYRSKSEAMFARWLEISIGEEFNFDRLNCGGRCGAGGFVYEPSFLTIGEWTPDFFRWAIHTSKATYPSVYGTSIEYKPSKPTITYLDEFAIRCSALTEIAPYPCSYELYYGGFFDKPAGLILWDADYGIHEAPHYEFNWIGGHAPEVMATRFDLEAA